MLKYPFIMNCKYCKKEYNKKSHNHVFCSDKCRKKYDKKKYIQEKYEGKKCYISGKTEDLEEHHIIMGEPKSETVFLWKKYHKIIHKFMTMLEIKGYKIVKKS